MFFIQIIWWIRTRQIFKNFDQKKNVPTFAAYPVKFVWFNKFDQIKFDRVLAAISQ